MDILNNIPIQLRGWILPVAAVCITIGGFLWMVGAFSTNILAMAKGSIGNTLIGAILAFGGATMIVLFLRGLGVGG